MTIETKLQELYSKIEQIPAEKWVYYRRHENRGERAPLVLIYGFSAKSISIEEKEYGNTIMGYILRVNDLSIDNHMPAVKENDLMDLYHIIYDKYFNYQLEIKNKERGQELVNLHNQIDSAIEYVSEIK